MPRTRAFDPEDALDRAMLLFWERGFARTSITDLVDATGVNRHSLYGTWGDKRGLFLAALDRYLDRITAAVIAPLQAPEPDLGHLRRFADQFLAHIHSPPGSFGCLIALTAAEVAAREPDVGARIAHHRQRMEAAFLHVLRGAEARGQLRRGLSLEDEAIRLAIFTRGLAIEARAGTPPAHLSRAIDAALAILQPLESP